MKPERNKATDPAVACTELLVTASQNQKDGGGDLCRTVENPEESVSVHTRVSYWALTLLQCRHMLEGETARIPRVMVVCERLLNQWQQAGYPDLGEWPDNCRMPSATVMSLRSLEMLQGPYRLVSSEDAIRIENEILSACGFSTNAEAHLPPHEKPNTK